MLTPCMSSCFGAALQEEEWHCSQGFMGRHWPARRLDGNLMDPHVILMGDHGDPWGRMETPWRPMGTPMGPHRPSMGPIRGAGWSQDAVRVVSIFVATTGSIMRHF